MIDLNVIWVVGCAGLVLLMQPGFMCLESGLTRSKNSINVAIKNLVDLGVSICFFWVFGFAVMFGASLAGWFGTSGFFLPVEQDPALAAFFIFQAMFAGTSTTIVSGALAERLKFTGYVAIAMLISGVIYPLFGHWAWNGTNGGELTGWLGQLGFVDFAGSSVVHSIGGWVSLAALLVVGPRAGRFVFEETAVNGRRKRRPEANRIHGSNLPFSVLGVMLLWVGWLGFNGGSTFGLTEQIPSIIVHTILSGAAGMMAAGSFGYWQRRIMRPETLINGSLAGLVSITASCNVVSTPMAVVIGAMGGLIMLAATDLIERCGIDDGVDAVALHGVAGVWGTLAVALFGNLELIGTGLSRYQQLWVQLLGVGVAFVWGFGVTYIVLKKLNRIFPLRVSVEEEDIGLNVAEHDAKTEVYELFRVMDEQAKTQNFSLRVPEDPFTEAGKIARRYNDVMDSLESYAVQLHTLNGSLEKTVAERTQDLITANAHLADANQELQRLDRLKDDFLANTSHELKTPLNGIIGLSEYLIEDVGDRISPAALSNLSMIARSGRRLYQLVSDILDFSQILHDELTLQMSGVDLRAIAEVVLTLCRPLASSKNLQIINTLPDDLPLAWADENRLQQILYNLIGNAIKFTEQGRIEISAAVAENTLTIAVTDTGIGIAEEEFEHIFESFAQAESSISRAYEGLGLGLAITQKLVALHQGNLWVESTLGEGACFRFTLPVAADLAADLLASTCQSPVPVFNQLALQPLADVLSAKTTPTGPEETVLANFSDSPRAPLAARRSHSFTSATNHSCKVLIVDDDPINLRVLNNYLGLCDYQVVQASSGSEALSLLAEGYRPELVILDVMMPRMTGYEVTQAIRDQWDRDELPIVLLTAKNQLEDEVIGLQAGANDYLTKPIVKEGLLARIGTQLALRHESQRRAQAQAERMQFAAELEIINIELLAAKESLAQQNRTLEQQVIERTAVLEESQSTLSNLMKNIPGMVYRCHNDPDWTMTFVSEGCFDLTGYTYEDFETGIFKSCKQLVPPHEFDEIWQQVQVSLSRREPYRLIYEMQSQSGETKWVIEQGRGVLDEAGEIKYLEGFITDINDRVLFEKQLKQSNQELSEAIKTLQDTQSQLQEAKAKAEAANSAKSDFLASMSHELRSPLNSIIGFAQLLIREDSLSDHNYQRVQIIYRSAETLLALINGILDISKIEAGKISLNPVEFNLYCLLRDVVNLFTVSVQQKGVQLHLHIDPDVPNFAVADEGKLRQILTNLVANAVKFTSQGRIDLSVRAERAAVATQKTKQTKQILQFVVQDTGCGIAPNELAQLFLPFEQATAGRAMRQGTGLGLFISQQYAQLMGSNITVSSTPGQGSRFEFQILIPPSDAVPAQAIAPVTAQEIAQPSLTYSRRQPKSRVVGIAPDSPEYRILVVDDLPDNQQLLTDLLRSVGFVTRQVANGQAAVELWQSWHPHFIWMDLLMPVMDGYEAMRQIKAKQAARLLARPQQTDADPQLATESMPTTIIAALTASVLKEDKREIIAIGFDDCVFKPFHESVIWSTLAKHLGVEFIYETHNDPDFGDERLSNPLAISPESAENTARISSQKMISLTAEAIAEALREMPSAWLNNLHQASRQLKGRKVMQLIEQIPPSQNSLAHSLKDIAENYQFETIVAIIETL